MSRSLPKRQQNTIRGHRPDSVFSGLTSKKIAFSVPANFSSASIPSLVDTKANSNNLGVVEVYGNLNPSPVFVGGSGRAQKYLPQIRPDELKQYVAELSAVGIEFNYTLNASCLSDLEYSKTFRSAFIDFIKSLRDIGVYRLTIALPSLLEYLDVFSDIRVTISTVSGIISPSGVHFVEQFRNVDRICVPEYLNRNLTMFSELVRSTRLSVSTIVNSLCLLSCSFRQQHYNFNSHSCGDIEVGGREYFGVLCDIQRIDNPSFLLSSPWIRPEDIDKYVGIGVSLFKLAGREIPDADSARAVKHFQQRSYEGNLIDLFGCFGQNPYLDIFSLDNEDVAEVIPQILSRKMGCHELLCASCGICQQWTNQHHVIKKDASDIKSLLIGRLHGN